MTAALQLGNGGHIPTYALKVNISKCDFFKVFNFIQNRHYQFSSYSLTGNQCCQFVMQCAALIDIDLPAYKNLEITPYISFNKKKFLYGKNINIALLL